MDLKNMKARKVICHSIRETSPPSDSSLTEGGGIYRPQCRQVAPNDDSETRPPPLA